MFIVCLTIFECINDVGNLCTPENLFGWVKDTFTYVYTQPIAALVY